MLAEVSERARIVQEQVDKQFMSLVDRVAGQTERNVAEAGGEAVRPALDQLEELRSRFEEISKQNVAKGDVDQLKTEISTLPAGVNAVALEVFAPPRKDL